MKTNKTMIRPMGEFNILQRTDNRMFNATQLLDQWNRANPDNQRRLDKFWDSTHLPELMEEIVRNEYPDVDLTSYSKKKGLKKSKFNTPKFGELKKILCKTKAGRYGSGTWMHPMLFIKFAMYLNPRFEYQVLKFIQDELIKYRHEAGDQCNAMKKALSGIITDPSTQYPHVMKALNLIIFGQHDKDVRQTGTAEQLKELATLESFISESISCGLIRSFEHLLEVLRNKYRQKYYPAAAA